MDKKKSWGPEHHTNWCLQWNWDVCEALNDIKANVPPLIQEPCSWATPFLSSDIKGKVSFWEKKCKLGAKLATLSSFSHSFLAIHYLSSIARRIESIERLQQAEKKNGKKTELMVHTGWWKMWADQECSNGIERPAGRKKTIFRNKNKDKNYLSYQNVH